MLVQPDPTFATPANPTTNPCPYSMHRERERNADMIAADPASSCSEPSDVLGGHSRSLVKAGASLEDHQAWFLGTSSTHLLGTSHLEG